MKPIPETVEALDALGAQIDDDTLLDQMHRTTALAQGLVPDLVGFSIAAHKHGVTFTVAATDDEIAALDGVQYLAHGPCVDALEERQGVATSSVELFSEPRWRAFAQATAAAGIRSTVTVPIIEDGEVTGTVNLYGASDGTFEGKHRLLATVFSAWAPGAVTNADLSFSTRRLAEQAPEQLHQDGLVHTATGILAATRGLTVDNARLEIEDSAARAGVPASVLARIIIDLHQDVD